MFVIRSSSIIHFANGNIGCVTQHGKIVVSNPSGLMTKRHPTLENYLRNNAVKVDKSGQMMIEYSTDPNEFDIEVDLLPMQQAA